MYLSKIFSFSALVADHCSHPVARGTLTMLELKFEPVKCFLSFLASLIGSKLTNWTRSSVLTLAAA
eukprot:1943105-Amphidinium_carterae.1